jgi:hypothetical protein
MSVYKNNVEIVVARYNESLLWLDEYPFNQFEYIVYNKGDNDYFVKKNVKKIININNVGRCDHTYLYHITENYNNLSNIVVFFPGSLNMKDKKNIAINILNNIISSNYTSAFFIGNYYNSVRENFKNFQLEYHKCGYSENYIKNKETVIDQCKLRPYGNWYNYFFGNTPAHWVAFSGIFSIDKKDIIQHPVNRYILLKNIVSNHSNPEAGHYIERSWGKIFYPLIYTKKIKL